jgi:chromosome segregation ATPase
MRVLIALVSVVLLATCAVGEELPPGFNSATDLASVLANEPDAARFAQVSGIGGADTITFKDDSPSGGYSEYNSRRRAKDEEDADTAEFDSQIEQINQDLKKLREAIRESEECARRLTEQQAEVRSLNEQKEHLEKEKEKRILQTKLEKQMKDLSEINRMSRALRTKFSELKHTQKLIKTKMSGTRSSLNQLDSDSEPLSSADMSEAADDLGTEVDAMQKAQAAILAKTHSRNSQAVRKTITTANSIHKRKDDSNDFNV